MRLEKAQTVAFFPGRPGFGLKQCALYELHKGHSSMVEQRITCLGRHKQQTLWKCSAGSNPAVPFLKSVA